MDLQTFFITTTCVIGICIIVIIMQKYLINNTNNIKKIIEKLPKENQALIIEEISYTGPYEICHIAIDPIRNISLQFKLKLKAKENLYSKDGEKIFIVSSKTWQQKYKLEWKKGEIFNAEINPTGHSVWEIGKKLEWYLTGYDNMLKQNIEKQAESEKIFTEFEKI